MLVTFDKLIEYLYPRWSWLFNNKWEFADAIVKHGLRGFDNTIKYDGGGLFYIKEQ